jgi:hypothetical protein
VTVDSKARRFTFPNYKGTISVSEFRKLPKDAKKEVMRVWFSERYEDPVNSSPWVDGEYVFINGGPYDAHEVLQDEFSGLVAEDAITELAEELSSDCSDWTGASDRVDYQDYDDPFDEYSFRSERHAQVGFEQSAKEIRQLLQSSQISEQHYLRMLYSGVITALETYLSDFFINIIKGQRGYLEAFIEKNEQFAVQKFTLNKIFLQMSQIEKTAIDYLKGLMWHDLAKISSIYAVTLEIEFPKIPELYKAILTRHDLVHRSGKTKDGVVHLLEALHVENVLNQAESLVKHIEDEWKKKQDERYAEIRDLL